MIYIYALIIVFVVLLLVAKIYCKLFKKAWEELDWDWDMRIISIISFAILALILYIYDTTNPNDADNLIKENGEVTNAVIYDFYDSRSHKTWKTLLYYKYIVDGNKYEGSGHWYTKSDKLSVGDTIIIKYSKKRPDFSRPVRDLNRSWWKREGINEGNPDRKQSELKKHALIKADSVRKKEKSVDIKNSIHKQDGQDD
jgi:hypothetical protein